MGIPVYITRDKDITLNPTDRVNEVLKAFGNNKDVVVISNHLNAGGHPQPSRRLNLKGY